MILKTKQKTILEHFIGHLWGGYMVTKSLRIWENKQGLTLPVS